MNYFKIICVALLPFAVISCEPTDSDSYTGAETYTMKQKKSSKRGVSFNFSSMEDVEALRTISWYYNWGSQPNAVVDPFLAANNIEYCPMAWNGAFDADAIRLYKLNHPDCHYLLAFNEPNLNDQARMTPQEAAEQWPRLKSLADELGMKIVSPAMNYGTLANYHDPIKWLDEFFTLIPASDVDAIAIHCYMSVPSSLMSYVNLFKKYGKPIWMTEFCAWEKNISSAKDQMAYMCDVLNFMENDPAIERYAWFIPRTDGSGKTFPYMQLLTNNKFGELTDLGRVFVNFSSLDTTLYYVPDEVIPAFQYANMNIEVNGSELTSTSSVRVQPTTDSEGLFELSGFSTDKWVEYKVEVPTAGKYEMEYRYSAPYDSNSMELFEDGARLDEFILNTYNGERYAWGNFKHQVMLKPGKHTLRLKMANGNIFLHWIRINTLK